MKKIIKIFGLFAIALFLVLAFMPLIESAPKKETSRRIWINGNRKQVIINYNDGSYSIDIYEWDAEVGAWVFIKRQWYAVPGNSGIT